MTKDEHKSAIVQQLQQQSLNLLVDSLAAALAEIEALKAAAASRKLAAAMWMRSAEKVACNFCRAAFRLAASRETRVTLAPSSKKAWAQAKPMPLLPPVITTCLSRRCRSMGFSSDEMVKLNLAI